MNRNVTQNSLLRDFVDTMTQAAQSSPVVAKRGTSLGLITRMSGGAGLGFRHAVALLLLCMLSACGGNPHLASTGGGSGNYAPPGPPEDPWGPYITQASSRFSVPDRWIRAVMRQESGGHQYLNGQLTTSDAGAAGLMQLMPATYAELRDRYGLGGDPYDPHDNIFAGTAYIRELYDRFGSPAFLAAYDAGPNRVDSYMAGRGGLPNETVNYLAAVAPRLGNDLPMSGPLAAYADNGGASLTPDPVPHPYAKAPIARCWRDPDAAYDPDAPCRAAPPARVAALAPPPPIRQPQAPSAQCWRDPNAAYDPDAPCRTRPVQVAESAPVPLAQATAPGGVLWSAGEAPVSVAPVHVAAATQAAPPRRHSLSSYLIPSAAAAELPPMRASGAWAIQVGAFADAGQARRVADSARGMAPRQLDNARTVLGATTPFGGQILYRARLLGLSAESAASACSALAARRQACVTVPPGG